MKTKSKFHFCPGCLLSAKPAGTCPHQGLLLYDQVHLQVHMGRAPVQRLRDVQIPALVGNNQSPEQAQRLPAAITAAAGAGESTKSCSPALHTINIRDKDATGAYYLQHGRENQSGFTYHRT